jgi:hypothetical protein
MALSLLFGAVAFAVDLNYLGSFEPPREGWVFEGINVGEISGLTLSKDGDSFFAIGDDRGENVDPPGVLYELKIDLDEDGIHGVDVTGVVQLKTPDGQPYEANTLDGEDVLWTPNGFIVSSERDLENKPWVRMFSPSGEFLSEVPIPEKFIPLFENEEQVRGVRRNLSFEATAITPDYATLYVMNEQALIQDGETSTPEAGTPVRLIEYDLSGDEPVVVGEYVYVTEPMFATPPEGKSGDNGVPGMVYVGHITSEFDLIVMERSYVSGAGNQIGLFGVKLGTGENVMALDALADPENPRTISVLEKFPLLVISDDPELTEVPFDPDNMEAIALGPQLSNGNYTLIIAADNNFNPKYQRNVFAAFEIVLGE